MSCTTSNELQIDHITFSQPLFTQHACIQFKCVCILNGSSHHNISSIFLGSEELATNWFFPSNFTQVKLLPPNIKASNFKQTSSTSATVSCT